MSTVISSLYLNTRKSCGFPTPGSVQGQAGRVLEHTGIVQSLHCAKENKPSQSVCQLTVTQGRGGELCSTVGFAGRDLSVLKGYF